MSSKRVFDEVRVYEGVAERTGVQVDRDTVRRSESCCRSLTELLSKARRAGDGSFYLPHDAWPADTDRVQLQKEWIVISSAEPRNGRD